MKNIRRSCIFFLGLGLLVSLPKAIAHPQHCDREEFATRYVTSYLQATPLTEREIERTIAHLETLTEAECQQRGAIALLRVVMGNPIGYKVAATSKKVQEIVGSDRPLVGVLLAEMLLHNGATIAVNSGGSLIYEVDLLVTVGDERINEAETIADVAAHLQNIIPFIEVPDLMLPRGSSLSPELLVAMNVGVRWGVKGEEIPVQATPEFIEALAQMTVTLENASGEILTEAQGRDILGHPFNSVLFLVKHLRDRGKRLKAGDVISLGTFGRFHFAASGEWGIARYQGLPGGDRTVEVFFE
ncbi:MAG: hydratase [Cyanobacteria bacterium SBLK]|nr:hydratase [Cyanobacteria bacterium SBLK]